MSTTLQILFLKILTKAGKKSLISKSTFGYPYRISLGDYFSENPFFNPYANVGEILATAAWVYDKPKPVIADIGAHCGFIATQLAQLLRGKFPVIYSFEPVAPTFADLVRAIDVLSLTEFIHPIGLALSDKSGFVKLNYSKWESMLAQVVPEGMLPNQKSGNRSR